MEKIKNIYQRINQVMQQVSYVQKDARFQGQTGVTHDQVVSVARKAMVEAGIVVYPEQVGSSVLVEKSDKNKMMLYSGEYVINFVNMDNPADKIPVPVNAHANDNGDKAPGKCITYATKMAILKVLCLETGENDESRADTAEKLKTMTPEQLAEIDKLLQETGNSEKWWSKICKSYRAQSPDQLLASKFEEIVKRINDGKQKAAESGNN